MKELLAITKAFSDENRVRIILVLRGRELCVCQLIELLGLAPSTVSKHISILKQAGLVDLRKDGRWCFYRLADEEPSQAVLDALEWIVGSASYSRRALDDNARMQEILKCDLEEICKRINVC